MGEDNRPKHILICGGLNTIHKSFKHLESIGDILFVDRDNIDQIDDIYLDRTDKESIFKFLESEDEQYKDRSDLIRSLIEPPVYSIIGDEDKPLEFEPVIKGDLTPIKSGVREFKYEGVVIKARTQESADRKYNNYLKYLNR